MSMFSGLVEAANPYMLYIKIGAVVVALSAVVGFYAWVHHAFVERAELKVKVSELSTQIKTQNFAIDEWKKAAGIANKKIAAAQLSAAKVQVVYRTKVEKVMSAAVPAACPEAIKWGITQGVASGKDWENAQ